MGTPKWAGVRIVALSNAADDPHESGGFIGLRDSRDLFDWTDLRRYHKVFRSDSRTVRDVRGRKKDWFTGVSLRRWRFGGDRYARKEDQNDEARVSYAHNHPFLRECSPLWSYYQNKKETANVGLISPAAAIGIQANEKSRNSKRG